MTLSDFISMGFWIAVAFALAFMVQQIYYRGRSEGWYLYPALGLKLFGGLAFTAIYSFHYGSGDTLFYFSEAQWLSQEIIQRPSALFDLLNTGSEDYSVAYVELLSKFDNPTTVLLIKICAVFNLLSYNSIWGTTALFASCSTFGLWCMFRVFDNVFPGHRWQMAFSVFMIPSVFFWGSGIMKDTMMIACLGFALAGFYFSFIKRKSFFLAPLLLLGSLYAMAHVKIYILFALLPSFFIWFTLHYWMKSRRWSTRVFYLIVGSIFLAPVLLLSFALFGKSAGLMLVDQFVVATRYQLWHEVIAGANNSYYNLGEIEISFFGILKKVPAAINVALFRPYITEIRAPIMVPSFFESAIFFLLTLFVVLRSGIFRSMKIVLSHPALLGFLFFLLSFAFITGFTSFNFGALARYKIPMLPFFAAILFIIYSKAKAIKIAKKRRMY